MDGGDQTPIRIFPQFRTRRADLRFLTCFYATACAKFQPVRLTRLYTRIVGLWIVSGPRSVNSVDKLRTAARLAGHTRFPQVNRGLCSWTHGTGDVFRSTGMTG